MAWSAAAAAPPGGEVPPAPPEAREPGDAAARAGTCPRCGYLCDAGWRFCAACGWDRRILVGEEAQARLEELTRATVGVTVVKRQRDLSDRMTEKEWRRISRFFTTFKGHRKQWSTAFPFGPQGVYVTSASILEDAEEVKLRTAGNLEYPARVAGIDPVSDVGVVRAEVPGSSPIRAAAEGPASAEDLYSICFPVAVEETTVRYLPVSVHLGQISATGQSGTGMASVENLLRTDHALPSGCLGGPLVDRRGHLAGMILGWGDTGITYGVPAADFAPIVGPLADGRPVERPYFGLGLVALDARRRARFHIDGDVEHPLVGFLIPGSPAAESGVRAGDLLTAVGDLAVATVSEAGARLLEAGIGGDAVTLTLLRGTEELRVPVRPVARPRRILLDPLDEIQEALEANLVEVATGPTAAQGLKVTDLVRGGRGEENGYKEGDLITEVEGTGVRRFETFRQVVRSTQKNVFQDAGSAGKEGGASGDRGREIDTYFIVLGVRGADGERTRRSYSNLYPGALAPPVY
jgi:S1-C subfamily serine protease